MNSWNYILDEAKFLLGASKDVDWESFRQDEILKRAFVRSIEIMGEAVKQIPDSIRQQNPGVEWRAIAGMRDRLIHAYYGVNYRMFGIPSPTKSRHSPKTLN